MKFTMALSSIVGMFLLLNAPVFADDPAISFANKLGVLSQAPKSSIPLLPCSVAEKEQVIALIGKSNGI